MKKLYFMLAAMVFAVAGYLSPQVMASKTVYFANTDNWGDVYIHSYQNSNSSNNLGGWSANKMTKTDMSYGTASVYKFTYPSDKNNLDVVMFHNNNGTQTGEINSVSDGALYVWDNSGGWKVSKKDAPTSPTNYYLFGNINSNDAWGTKTTMKQTSKDGYISYIWDVTFTSEKSYFRIYDGTNEWRSNAAGDNNYTVNGNVSNDVLSKGSNGCYEISKGHYIITLYSNWDKDPSLSITKSTDPVGTITDYWLRGKFTDWGTDDTYKFTPDAKGEVYTLIVNNGKLLCDNSSDTSDNFGFKVGAAGSSNWESYSTGNSSMELNTLYADMTSTDNMKLKSGSLAENTPVTVIFNKKNKTIIFKTENDPEPPTPDKYPVLYLSGDFNSFAFDEAYKFRLAGHTYRLTVKAGTLNDKSFKIADNGYNWQFTCGNNNVANINQDYNNVTSGGADNMKLNLSYVNPNTNVNIIVNITDLAAKKANIRFEAVEDNPDQYRTLYMNFLHELGDEALGDDKLSTSKPWVRLYNGRLENWDAVKNWDNSVVHEMKQVGTSQIYQYTLTDEELRNYNNAIFYIPIKEHDGNGGNKFYICNANPDNFGNGAIDSEKENYKNGWRNWDDTYWLKYVYCVSGEGLAAQSYITYDEYQKLLPLPKEEIYFTGENVQNIGWDPTQKLVSEKTVDGVAYWKNNPEDSGKGVKFKMSWLHPVDMYNDCLSKTLTNQRAWATFNMGLISVHKERAKYSNGSLIYTPVKDTNGVNDNLQVNLNKIIPYSDQTAENWFMDKSASDQWLVIDTHEECKSVTLLSFEPNPTLSVTTGDVKTISIDPEEAAKLHEDQVTTGHVFHGEETNGLAHITTLNTLGATATIKAEFAALSQNGADMTVTYDFYSNGQVFYTTDGSDPNNKIFTINNIAIGGDNSSVGARGLYKDNKTTFQFHSKFTNGVLSGNFKAASPEITSIGTKGYAVMNDAPETLSAMFSAQVTLPTNGVVYPDFEVKVNENSSNNYHLSAPEKANGGEIVHSNHAVAKQYTWFDKVDYTPATSASGYDHNTHNWASKLGAENAEWPLYLPDVLKLANDDDEEWYGESGDMKTTLDFTAYAVYPFLVNRKANVTASDKSSSAPRRALDASGDYHIELVRMPASTTVELDEKSPLTGIDDIVAPEADAEAVYYTLDGRLAGSNPAAGVYIRRVGNKAEKIYIR